MKPFKTAEEQINILKSRGLIISDEDYAKKFLIKRNYYSMINGYSKFFMNGNRPDHYVSNATLEEIEAVYIFDKEFKGILFTHLLEVEKYLKAILAYHFSAVYPGTHDYLDINNYNCQTPNGRLRVINIISRIAKVISDYSGRGDGNAIEHYLHKHNGVPLWVVIQFMYFGDVIELYKCCSLKVRNDVAKEFNDFLMANTGSRKTVLSEKDLTTILYQVKNVRNIVAHNNKLFNYVPSKNSNSIPYIPAIHARYGIKSSENRNSAYQTFLIMQCLISKNEYAHLHNSIRKRIRDFKKRIHSVDYNVIVCSYGFPKNWCDTEKPLDQSK